jgi:hypothetical protein
MCWRKDSLFDKRCCQNWVSTCGRRKLDPSLSPCTRVNSEWVKNLQVRSDIDPEKRREHTGPQRHRSQLCEKNSNSSAIKGTNDKWGCMKLKAQQRKQSPE